MRNAFWPAAALLIAVLAPALGGGATRHNVSAGGSNKPEQGDINCDDSITIQDFSLLLGLLAGCPRLGQGVGVAGHVFMDLNCDAGPDQPPGARTTGVDARDALTLLASFAGLTQQGVPPDCPTVGDRLS